MFSKGLALLKDRTARVNFNNTWRVGRGLEAEGA